MLALLSTLGFPLGLLINKYTKEELQQGEVYFKAAYRIILFLIGVYALIQASLSLPLDFLLIGGGLLAGWFIKKEFIYTALVAPFTPPLTTTAFLSIQTTLATTQQRNIHNIFIFASIFLIVTITKINLLPFAGAALLIRSFK